MFHNGTITLKTIADKNTEQELLDIPFINVKANVIIGLNKGQTLFMSNINQGTYLKLNQYLIHTAQCSIRNHFL